MIKNILPVREHTKLPATKSRFLNTTPSQLLQRGLQQPPDPGRCQNATISSSSQLPPLQHHRHLASLQIHARHHLLPTQPPTGRRKRIAPVPRLHQTTTLIPHNHTISRSPSIFSPGKFLGKRASSKIPRLPGATSNKSEKAPGKKLRGLSPRQVPFHPHSLLFRGALGAPICRPCRGPFKGGPLSFR